MAAITDAGAYLATEARIIAENDHYVVIALRIPKRIVHRNLGLLAALADLSPLPPARRRPARLAVTARSRRRP